MTKQFLITVQMGEATRQFFKEEQLLDCVRIMVNAYVTNGTSGPVPLVEVHECLDADTEDLTAFTKEVLERHHEEHLEVERSLSKER